MNWKLKLGKGIIQQITKNEGGRINIPKNAGYGDEKPEINRAIHNGSVLKSKEASMNQSFLDRVSARLSPNLPVIAEDTHIDTSTPTDGPEAQPIGPGSSSPDNWQGTLQTGLNEHQIRELAQALNTRVSEFQFYVPELMDIWEHLMIGGGKHFELHLPIIIKGVSREKLTKLAEILTKVATHAIIK